MEPAQIAEIFFPYSTAKSAEVKEKKKRFAYYTNAETAYRIISGSQIWMRSTATMNDILEVEHGFECLNAAYKSPAGDAFKTAVDSAFPGLTEEVVAHFNGWLPHIRNDTYIACFSEHLDSEDSNGRLSMWRAYGGTSGVAIVIKGEAMALENDSLGVYASPVAYWEAPQIEAEFANIAKRLKMNFEVISSMQRELVKVYLFNIFRFLVLCTKHPGFSEEREWRAITSPILDGSAVREHAIEIVRGTPQVVQKFHFRNVPEKSIDGLALSQVIDRVIIGPCEFPQVVWKALYHSLKDVGFSSPESVIHISAIPLRPLV